MMTSDGERVMTVRHDQVSFTIWEPGKVFNDRLRFDNLEVGEDVFRLHFWCPRAGQGAVIHAGAHLLVRYANESANFLEFDQLPIEKSRMWVSDSSDWLKEVSVVSGGVFDNVRLKHYLFIFSNASIEMLSLDEPSLTMREPVSRGR